jgi:fluoride exporter
VRHYHSIELGHHGPVRTPTVGLVAVGGAAGALARHGVTGASGGTVAGTLLVNLSGCLLIGLLLAVVEEGSALRPLLGTGVLGGYTTFSGYALDVHTLMSDGRTVLAATYLFGTVAGALAAAWLGSTPVRRTR